TPAIARRARTEREARRMVEWSLVGMKCGRSKSWRIRGAGGPLRLARVGRKNFATERCSRAGSACGRCVPRRAPHPANRLASRRNLRRDGKMDDAKPTPRLISTADAIHALLVKRADRLEGFLEGSADEVEYAQIADSLVAYEEQHWPNGKARGGKG